MKVIAAGLRTAAKLREQPSIAFALVLICFTALTCTSAAKTQSVPESHAKLELVADATGPSSNVFWAGLLFHLDPGWHVYWQNAGDSGTPPKINWQLPAGYHAGAIRWPTPVRLGHGSIVDYGYEGEVLLMAPIERRSTAKQNLSAITADVKYVVCREVCMPGKAHLDLPISAGAAPDFSQWHVLFDRTRAQLPKPLPATWKASVSSDTKNFALSVQTPSGVKKATFFPLDSAVIENSAPQNFLASANGFRLTLRKSDLLTQPVSTLKGLLVLEPRRAFEIAVPVVAR